MDANGSGKRRGRPPKKRGDPTMRYIEKKQLWDAIALQCGISPVAVRQWERVPWKRVLDVERATGRARHLIRPDIYPD
jgi:hypothetical protein